MSTQKYELSVIKDIVKSADAGLGGNGIKKAINKLSWIKFNRMEQIV